MSIVWVILVLLLTVAGLTGLAWRFGKVIAPVALALAATSMLCVSLQLKLVTAKPALALIVDRSGSTRTADYRDEAQFRRLVDLLRSRADVIVFDLNGKPLTNPPDESIETVRTLDVPEGMFDQAILLSDGLLDTRAWPDELAILTAADPQLNQPADARVQDVRRIAGRSIVTFAQHRAPGQSVVASVSTVDTQDFDLPPLPQLQQIELPARPNDAVTARLNPGDAWPENDQLTLPPDDDAGGVGWIGPESIAGAEPLEPSDLNTASLLRFDTIVMFDPDAADFNDARSLALQQFVTDLGGTLIVNLGPNATRSFARDQRLDALLPVALDPPTPRRQWTLLVDSSGSMAGKGDSGSSWQFATDAVVGTASALPENDLFRVGTFARDLSWLMPLTPVANRSGLSFATVSPGGPTNLRAAIDQALLEPSSALPNELIIITDALADLPDASSLGLRLKEARTRVTVITTARVPGDHPLALLVAQTGGQVLTRTPADLSGSLGAVVKAMSDRTIDPSPRVARLKGILEDVGEIELRNRPTKTWPRQGSHRLDQDSGQDDVAAAQWQRGLGQVIALAGTAIASDMARVVRTMPILADDLSFELVVDSSDRLVLKHNRNVPVGVVSFEIVGANYRRQFNGVEQNGSAVTSEVLVESVPAARAVASVDGVPVARRLLGSMPHIEYRRLGNDPAALSELARRTGGEFFANWQTADLPSRVILVRQPVPPWVWALTCMACTVVALSAARLHRR